MSILEFDSKKLTELSKWLGDSKHIIITCHLSPDGDALGSSLGLQCVLSKLNPAASVSVVTPDEPTHTLDFLPYFDKIKAYSHYPAKVANLIKNCDLIVCLDFNELNRTDRLAPLLESAKAKKILIDHHLYPSDFADLTFSYPHKPATCMVLYQILEKAGLRKYIDADAANCFLTGMMTDTINFSVSTSDPAIYPVVGQLVELGADRQRLNRLLFNTHSESFLRIQGFALAERMQLFHNTHAGLIVLWRDDLNKFNYQKGDTEGLVNRPLEVPGILYSCFLREEEDYIKVSMRSLGNFPVNELCSEYFGGGGHLNAAGGEFPGTMDECIAKFIEILEINKKRYIDGNPVLESILNEN